MKVKNKHPLLWGFLLIETGLYIHLLCTNHPWSMFGSIALCFLFALIHCAKENRWIVIGLATTVMADICLVLCQPQKQVLGMVFFLGTQIAYAVYLQHRCRSKGFLFLRLGVILLAEAITLLVLKEQTDALALISLAYYANLVVSIVEGFSQGPKNILFPPALVLFLLCDTVIGLQVAANGYLSIAPDSALYQILYPGINLAWLFYLPSQVLIALEARRRNA